MQEQYRKKLIDIVTKIIINANGILTDEELEEYQGIVPVALLVAMQSICITKGYTDDELDQIYTVCEALTKSILEKEVKLPKSSQFMN